MLAWLWPAGERVDVSLMGLPLRLSPLSFIKVLLFIFTPIIGLDEVLRAYLGLSLGAPVF